MSIGATISYIIPVHNGERFIAAAINSILAQTLPPLEVIVVDDGSTDDTASVVARFGDRVHCFQQQRAGPAAARNCGVDIATGQFLAFLDADDLIHPQKLETQLSRFAERPELQLCGAYLRNFWSPEIPEKERFLDPRQRLTHSERPRADSIITWLLRRELFHVVGRFDERKTVGEDTEWRDRVTRSGVPTTTLNEIVALRRLHGANLTLRRYDEFLREVLRNQKRAVTRVQGQSHVRG